MRHVTILGAGLVGSAMARDLAADADIQVTSVDRNKESLAALSEYERLTCVEADLSDRSTIEALTSEADLVISAVPGFMGYRTLERIVRAGKDVVDISFFPEDALLLDDLAKEKNVNAVVDCGVAPGLCNVIAGFVDDGLDRTDRYECYVGGLPQNREGPFEYKAVFSPIDVLEEYVRPARFVEHGEIVTRPALSDVEQMDLPGVDTLEAFNTDGLRSLLKTMDIPFMKEKTLRYPGHADLMRVFRDSGFFQTNEIEVAGKRIRPIDLTSQLLFEQWQMKPGEKDFTVMRVILEGERSGKQLRYTYDLLDRLDEKSGIHSMARTTGFTATVVARLLLDGSFGRSGINPPEFLGRTAGFFEKLKSGLDARNIRITETIEELHN